MDPLISGHAGASHGQASDGPPAGSADRGVHAADFRGATDLWGLNEPRNPSTELTIRTGHS